MSYRTLKTNALASLLALSVLSVACEGPFVPHPPPPPPPPPPEVTYTISGAVTEIVDGESMPVEGVLVRETSSNQSVMTDSKGLYSISGVKALRGSVVAIKEGYVTFAGMVSGPVDTRLDIRVTRIVFYTLSGMAYERTATGRVPIPGIVLYCDGCGSPVGHTYVTTDADGLYTLEWTPAGTTQLMIIGKAGYDYFGPSSGIVAGAAMVAILTAGDTRFDFEFVRR